MYARRLPHHGVGHDRGSVPNIRLLVPGVVVATIVAVVAYLLGLAAPVIGAPVFGIVLGLIAGTAFRRLRAQDVTPGYRFAAKHVLQASIVILGTGLSLRQIVKVGGSSLPVMLGTLAVALVGAWLIGRRLGLDQDVTTLIGVGTGICGASAIAAVTAVIKPKQADVAYAIGTIFTFNVAAVLLFPPLGHLLGMSGHSFGLWAGTAVNDTSSVVAAAYSFGAGAGPYAIVVKLVRTLMIIPICMTLGVLVSRRARRGSETGSGAGPVSIRRIFPMFIVLFVIASALRTVGVIPDGWVGFLGHLGVFFITVALAAIGLTIRPGQLRAAGHRPLVLGAMLWVLVALSSLGLQALTGTL